MSVNTAHANHGVLIHAGEYILVHTKSVTMNFSDNPDPVFAKPKIGRLYLTSHRIIFTNKRRTDLLFSFSGPFVLMSQVQLHRPMFQTPYMTSKIKAQTNGNFMGDVAFMINFKCGGASEFTRTLFCAAALALFLCKNIDELPRGPIPYQPAKAWYDAPEAAYAPPKAYFDWISVCPVFTPPRPGSVFMTNNAPPFPGIDKPTYEMCTHLPSYLFDIKRREDILLSMRTGHTEDPCAYMGTSNYPDEMIFPNMFEWPMIRESELDVPLSVGGSSIFCPAESMYLEIDAETDIPCESTSEEVVEEAEEEKICTARRPDILEELGRPDKIEEPSSDDCCV